MATTPPTLWSRPAKEAGRSLTGAPGTSRASAEGRIAAPVPTAAVAATSPATRAAEPAAPPAIQDSARSVALEAISQAPIGRRLR
jgi:hypothetical protein